MKGNRYRQFFYMLDKIFCNSLSFIEIGFDERRGDAVNSAIMDFFI